GDGVTLDAVWEANTNTLNFNATGGSGVMNAMSMKTDETKALTANAFTRAGYTFEGWATSENGEVVYENGANYTMGTESGYTLYAVWSINTNVLKFNANGGTGTMDALQIKTGAKKLLTENAFTKEGYVFLGWATSASGAVAYEDGAEYTMGTESEYTLYAVWGEAIKLYVYYDTYGLPHKIYEIEKGSTITLEELYSDKYVTEDIKTCPIYNVYSGWRTGYFTHWAYENNTRQDTFRMVMEDIDTAGQESVSIIARYGSTSTHNYLSHSNGTYTACPGGLGGVAYDLDTEKNVGSYQATITVQKGAEGEVGIAFNMFMSNDKDQSQKVGDNYYYAAFLPKDHSFVIGYVENGTWGGTVGTNLAYAGYGDVPEFFDGYYGLLGAGVTATFTLRVEVSAGKVEMFVSNFGGEQTAEVKVFTYENEALGKDGYSGWGVRAWGAQYTYSNVQYTANGQ
ncbi:MAG: InlB B-repeat-containing protein, partial [Clostridia bacterium]|nr:InlB B-repeat-containing protein [Clostridia bacterium]